MTPFPCTLAEEILDLLARVPADGDSALRAICHVRAYRKRLEEQVPRLRFSDIGDFIAAAQTALRDLLAELVDTPPAEKGGVR